MRSTRSSCARLPNRVSPPEKTPSMRRSFCASCLRGECPPCVAADVAASAVESTYAESEVIVLRYHQHIPAPDPLANEASDERFSSYDVKGTPALYVNGKAFSGAG